MINSMFVTVSYMFTSGLLYSRSIFTSVTSPLNYYVYLNSNFNSP